MKENKTHKGTQTHSRTHKILFMMLDSVSISLSLMHLRFVFFVYTLNEMHKKILYFANYYGLFLSLWYYY